MIEIVSSYLVWMSCYRPFLFASVLTRWFDLVISGVSFSWWIPVVSGECLQQIYMVHCLQQMRVCVTHPTSNHPTNISEFNLHFFVPMRGGSSVCNEWKRKTATARAEPFHSVIQHSTVEHGIYVYSWCYCVKGPPCARERWHQVNFRSSFCRWFPLNLLTFYCTFSKAKR